MNWQLRSRRKDRALDDQERRHLGAVKLFMESADSRHTDFAEALDKMSPRVQRELINTYHLWLENPEACIWSRRLGDWIFPFVRLRDGIAKVLARLIPLP